MIKTQVQLPDELYRTAKAIAEQREWSFAEVVRRGLEHMAIAYPLRARTTSWALPKLNETQFRTDFDQLDFKTLAEQDELKDLDV
jgi:hypothetical protein